MYRRQFLGGVTAAGVVGLAGCLGGDGGGSSSDSSFSTFTGEPEEVGGVELPVPRSELQRGAQKDAIPAITEPEFAADWASVSARLDDDEVVIGVERDGAARAYPLAVLNWHEIVNDDFDGPLLVTYCPLCGSGVTATRTVDGERTTFGVSGYLWKSDLVMYDEATGSLWSQIFATAIRGEETGTELELVPSTFATWGEWTESHPDTEVLLPPPDSNTITGKTSRNYEQNPYAGYENSRRIGVGGGGSSDDRLHPKTTVIGVTAGGEARAYPLDAVSAAGVVNDTVGDRPVVVAAGGDGTLVAYDRLVDGETLTFEPGADDTMEAGGSSWTTLTGAASSGPFEGTNLDRANDRSPMFWFAWADFNPETSIYRN
jgi:hypothetical protein